jgi:P pilus assembly chaperone PapD
MPVWATAAGLRSAVVGARASLSPSSVAVVPGGEAAVDVRIANTGTVVDTFTVTVVGAAADWATAEPPVVSLFPAAEETVRVVFRPPRTPDIVAGDVPFGVRVTSREDVGGSVTEEGVVTVAPFALVSLELVPRTSHGARRMVHDVTVTNDGNHAADVTLRAADPDQALAFALEPAVVSVAPGAASVARLKVRPVKTFGAGPPLTRLFQVVADSQPSGEPVAAADGMAVQEATRPAWLKRAVVWSLLGLLALVALWFLLLKPTVRSAAKEAALEATAPPTIGPGGGGSGSGSGASSGSGSGSSGSSGSGASTAGAATGAAGTPIDGRLFLTDKGSTDFTVPDGSTLQLTDIVLQNPAGNTGTLRIQRGDTALLVVELANFRDLDYHFVAPIVFTAGQKLVLAAECTSPGCTPGAYFAGFVIRA